MVISIAIFSSIFNSIEYLLLDELSIIGLTLNYHPNISKITDDEYKVTTRGILLEYCPGHKLLSDSSLYFNEILHHKKKKEKKSNLIQMKDFTG